MKDALSELEGIWSRCIENDRKYMFEEILYLLKKQGTRGIGIRQVDGELWQITLSKPTSVHSAFVIGLRYVKKNGKQAEDLIPVQKGRPIKAVIRVLFNDNGPSTEERTGKRSSLQELLTNHHPHGQ